MLLLYRCSMGWPADTSIISVPRVVGRQYYLVSDAEYVCTRCISVRVISAIVVVPCNRPLTFTLRRCGATQYAVINSVVSVPPGIRYHNETLDKAPGQCNPQQVCITVPFDISRYPIWDSPPQCNNNNNYLRQVNEVNGGDNAFVRCLSVCLSVCVRAAAGQWELMLIAQKRLKLRTSNLAQVFPGTVRTRPPKIFPKGGVARVT